MKAQGIDIANRASAAVALLLGAVGFQADSPVSKIRRDLAGLLYADGIHDSLFRTAGKSWAQSGRTIATDAHSDRHPAVA